VLLKIGECGLLDFLRDIGVDIQRGCNIGMSQYFLHHLDIHSGFTHPCGEHVAENVAAEVGEEDRLCCMGKQLLLVVITDDSPQSLVERALVLRIAKPVDEDEVRIPINASATSDSLFILALLFQDECFLYLIQQRIADTSLNEKTTNKSSTTTLPEHTCRQRCFTQRNGDNSPPSYITERKSSLSAGGISACARLACGWVEEMKKVLVMKIFRSI